MPVSYVTLKLWLNQKYEVPITIDCTKSFQTDTFQCLFHKTTLDLINSTGINWFTQYSPYNSAYLLYGYREVWSPVMFSLVEHFFGDSVFPENVKKLKTFFAELTLRDRAQIMINIFNSATNFEYNVTMASTNQFVERFDESQCSPYSAQDYNVTHLTNGFFGIESYKNLDEYLPNITGTSRIDIRSISGKVTSLSYIIVDNKNISKRISKSMNIVDFGYINKLSTPAVKLFSNYAKEHNIVISGVCGHLFVPKEHENAIVKLIDTYWDSLIPEECFGYTMYLPNVNILDFWLFDSLCENDLSVCEIMFDFNKKKFHATHIDAEQYDVIIAIDCETSSKVKIYAKEEKYLTLVKMYI